MADGSDNQVYLSDIFKDFLLSYVCICTWMHCRTESRTNVLTGTIKYIVSYRIVKGNFLVRLPSARSKLIKTGITYVNNNFIKYKMDAKGEVVVFILKKYNLQLSQIYLHIHLPR